MCPNGLWKKVDLATEKNKGKPRLHKKFPDLITSHISQYNTIQAILSVRPVKPLSMLQILKMINLNLIMSRAGGSIE